MCQSQQERGLCILAERLVVVSKMNFVHIFTGKLLSAREVSAPRSSRDVASWHFSQGAMSNSGPLRALKQTLANHSGFITRGRLRL